MLEVSSIIAYGYLAYSVKGVLKTVKNWIDSGDYSINMTCTKCISFWATLVWCGDLTAAALVSLTVLLLESFIVTKL